MILKKLATLSSILFYAALSITPAGAASGSYLDYGANNLSTKAPFWYPSHDWKFTWFFPATYTPTLRMTLVFNPPVHAPIIFDPVILGPQTLPLPRNFNFNLPSGLQFSLPSLSGEFTPTLKLVVSFIPSGGIGGAVGMLGSGAPPSDLTVTLPSIVFKPIDEVSSGPFSLVLPLPDSVSVPVPDSITISSPFPGGSILPVPTPGVSGGSDALPPDASTGGYIGGEPAAPSDDVASVPDPSPIPDPTPSHSAILSFFIPEPAPTPTVPVTPDPVIPPGEDEPAPTPSHSSILSFFTPTPSPVPATPPGEAEPTPTIPTGGVTPTPTTPPGAFVPPSHSTVLSFFVPVPTPAPELPIPPFVAPTPTPEPSHSVILSFFTTDPAVPPTTPIGGTPAAPIPPSVVPVPTPTPTPTPSHSIILSFFAPTPTAPTGGTSPIPLPEPPAPAVPSPEAPSAPSSGTGGGIGDVIGGIIDSVGGFFGGLMGIGSDFGDAPDGVVAYPDTSSGSGGSAAGASFCTSYVSSTPGPYKTTATAICGFRCEAGTPTIDFYTGVGTPFIGSAPPSYAPPDYSCNGRPTLGPSSVGCSCK